MIWTRKKKITAVFFIYIYLIFGAALGYLIFFGSGLELIEKPTIKQPEIFFKNNSSRIINNITISVVEQGGNKKIIQQIPKATAGEEVKIDLTALQSFPQATLIAQAPFYSLTEKQFILTEKKTGLSYNLRLPSIIFSNTSIEIELQACNELPVIKKAAIELVVDEQFFRTALQTVQLTIPPTDCAGFTFTVTPIRTGQTTVFFNIEVENNKERISKTLQIK